MLGNSSAGLHLHEGTITWDAVTVCRKGRVRPVDGLSVSAAAAKAAGKHTRSWTKRLAGLEVTPFRDADRANLQSAALVAAALGMFDGHQSSGSRPLREVLVEVSQAKRPSSSCPR
jgi:hypothetical protein